MNFYDTHSISEGANFNDSLELIDKPTKNKLLLASKLLIYKDCIVNAILSNIRQLNLLLNLVPQDKLANDFSQARIQVRNAK